MKSTPLLVTSHLSRLMRLTPQRTTCPTHMVFTIAMPMAKKYFCDLLTLRGVYWEAVLTCTSLLARLNQRSRLHIR